MLSLLIFHFRTAYGVFVPLAGVIVSTIWGIGIISLFGYNLDPLGLVIPFLISARAMSHGIQLVERYYAELNEDEDARMAAKKNCHLSCTSDSISKSLSRRGCFAGGAPCGFSSADVPGTSTTLLGSVLAPIVEHYGLTYS